VVAPPGVCEEPLMLSSETLAMLEFAEALPLGVLAPENSFFIVSESLAEGKAEHSCTIWLRSAAFDVANIYFFHKRSCLNEVVNCTE
jgi:hypothetical protein